MIKRKALCGRAIVVLYPKIRAIFWGGGGDVRKSKKLGAIEKRKNLFLISSCLTGAINRTLERIILE